MSETSEAPAPKRKRGPSLGEDLRRARGVLLVQTTGGWQCVSISVPQHTLAGISTGHTEPDMLAFALSAAEMQLREIAEQLVDLPRVGEPVARKDGLMTEDRARADLRALCDALGAEWGVVVAELQRFAETGILEIAGGRLPNADDRSLLQELSCCAGGWDAFIALLKAEAAAKAAAEAEKQ